MVRSDETEPPVCAAWRPARQPERLVPPADAWDMHAHIVGPVTSQAATRLFTAPEASVHDYVTMLDRLGIRHGMLVQPTVHGDDHCILLKGLRAYPSRLSGVAVIDATTSRSDLDAMRDAGVVGARLFDICGDGKAMTDLEAIASLCAAYGWFLQLAGPGRLYRLLEARIAGLRLPVVIDHFGWFDLANGVTGEDFRCLLRLVRGGDVYLKLSAANRLSKAGPPFPEILPFAKALIDAAPERLLWGSDWPHLGLDEDTPGTETMLDVLADCACEAVQALVLQHNPRTMLRSAKGD